MDPRKSLFVEELVKLENALFLEFDGEFVEGFVMSSRTHIEVGGFATHVLAIRDASHCSVELFATISRVDGNGRAIGVSERIEAVGDERAHVFHGGFGRRVVDMLGIGRIAMREFLNGKILKLFVLRRGFGLFSGLGLRLGLRLGFLFAHGFALGLDGRQRTRTANAVDIVATKSVRRLPIGDGFARVFATNAIDIIAR